LAIHFERVALEEFVDVVAKFIETNEARRALLLQHLLVRIAIENERFGSGKAIEWIITATRDIHDAAGASDTAIENALQHLTERFSASDILGEICEAGRN
jgi:hypothetical protein